MRRLRHISTPNDRREVYRVCNTPTHRGRFGVRCVAASPTIFLFLLARAFYYFPIYHSDIFFPLAPTDNFLFPSFPLLVFHPSVQLTMAPHSLSILLSYTCASPPHSPSRLVISVMSSPRFGFNVIASPCSPEYPAPLPCSPFPHH